MHEHAPNIDVSLWEPPSSEDSEKRLTKYIVIGAGPVGIRFAQELLKRRPDADITVFGNEPYQPYNRVQLSSLLAGEISYDEIITALPDVNKFPNFSQQNNTIRSIDVENKRVRDINGDEHPFDKLVIATGSRPHQPNIPGVDQAGVYTFRNLKDAESLYSRVSRARHIVVVGGGLLGLESAKALQKFNTEVTLIQQGERLMNRQLDDMAAGKLQEIIEELGINVITNSGVRQILGSGRVTGVITRDKETVECDTVLLCAGVKPNSEIARSAKIKIGAGILVDDQLQTSSPDIYAIGECCEHRGSTYGLVNPGYEQAAILAENFCRGHASYVGSLEVSRLKVVGASICSMGDCTDTERRPLRREYKYKNNKAGIYRKIVTYKGRITGAVGFGEWEESRRIQEAYQAKRRIWPWQALRFMLTGKLFGGTSQDDINLWPKATIVCQCNNISQGELVEAIDNGCDTVMTLQSATGAGTVCGSCKPLLSSLVGYNGPTPKEKAWTTTLIASVLAVSIAVLISVMPELRVSDSVQTRTVMESIWNDKFWKQVTGFSLLGMSTLGLLMSLRKRIASKRLGDYAYWRVLHVVLGVFCASTLILHTGFHLGSNFNQVLMIDFLGVLILGSLAGAVLSLSHKFSASTSTKIRSFWTWCHILFTWPLPILLGFHILTVYYY